MIGSRIKPHPGESQSGKNTRKITGALAKARKIPTTNPIAAAKTANAAEIRISSASRIGLFCRNQSSSEQADGPISRFFASVAAFAVKYFIMCRNIKTLFNFDPPVTPDEVRAASIQFVRKITGFNKPSKANEAAFDAAIDEVAAISMRLLKSLETSAPPKNREEEAAKAKARAAERFGT